MESAPKPIAFAGSGVLMTVDDVAQLLKLTRRAIYDLTSDRRLPFIKVGRLTRFLRSDVLAWLQGNRVPSLEQ